jgi:hypothetical protein
MCHGGNRKSLVVGDPGRKRDSGEDDKRLIYNRRTGIHDQEVAYRGQKPLEPRYVVPHPVYEVK